MLCHVDAQQILTCECAPRSAPPLGFLLGQPQYVPERTRFDLLLGDACEWGSMRSQVCFGVMGVGLGGVIEKELWGRDSKGKPE